MIWVLAFLGIIIIAFGIIKLTLNTKENPNSNLGILEHPSTFKKQKIEHVEAGLYKKENISNKDFKLTNEDE